MRAPLEEAQGLIDNLWALVQAQARQLEEQARQIEALTQRVRTLEERLHTNSRNSSTPPAADPHRPPAGKSPSGRKRSAQPGDPGKARTLLPPDQVTHAHDCVPGPCPGRGGAVKIAGLCGRHQVMDLPPMAPVVTEYRLFAGACHMLFLRHRIETLLRQGAAGRHAETARTCRHILRLREALWTCVDTPGVEPTNHLAERTLRGFVIWRKISFGTQLARGAR